MVLHIETELEVDGRWIAEVTDLPGVACYGASQSQAVASVKALALRVIADRIEHGELDIAGLDNLQFAAA